MTERSEIRRCPRNGRRAKAPIRPLRETRGKAGRPWEKSRLASPETGRKDGNRGLRPIPQPCRCTGCMRSKETEMHIEPGLVAGAKIVLSYATAAAAGGVTLKYAVDAVRAQGLPSLVLRRRSLRRTSS